MGKPAARVGDMHTCPLSDGNHAARRRRGDARLGIVTVLIGGSAGATVGNQCTCVSPAPDVIQQGSATVKIGGQNAARQGDATAHGGIISSGFANVLIGD
jgi:uncharacterized Zn-binding protein involved in type VI secretion